MTETAPGTPRPDYSRLFRLDGRTAVVVGGGSGIGREGALALAANGARVVVADMNREAADETAALGAGNGTLEAYELAVLDEFVELPHCGVVLEGVACHQHTACLLGRGDQPQAVGATGGQRLLDQHVLACREGAQRQ